jgi:hypothetical protein
MSEILACLVRPAASASAMAFSKMSYWFWYSPRMKMKASLAPMAWAAMSRPSRSWCGARVTSTRSL